MSEKAGRIELIWGCMFSGKTEEWQRRLRCARFARKKVLALRHAKDQRFGAPDEAVSHDQRTVKAAPVPSSEAVLDLFLAHQPEVLGVDEVQFFDLDIVQVCLYASTAGARVVAAGLDLNFLGQPFRPTMELAARAQKVDKLLAICIRCGSEEACRSLRLTEETEEVHVGGTESYAPRCQRCFAEEMGW